MNKYNKESYLDKNKSFVFEEPEYQLIGKDDLVGNEFEGGWIKTLVGAIVGAMIPGPGIPG